MSKDNKVADDFKAPGDPTKHDMESAKPNDHVSKKVYMFPESYNALRQELETHFPQLWTGVQWPMAFDAVLFIEMMDAALDTITQFDSGNVDGICKRYLDRLREKRGVSPLHKVSEYFHNEAMEKEIRDARDLNANGSLADLAQPRKLM